MRASRIIPVAAALALALTPLALSPAVTSGGGQRHDSLAALAARHHGLRIGTAVDTDVLAADAACPQVIVDQFSTVTPENVMKWQMVEPVQGQFDYAAADGVVRFARRNHDKVRGHTLVWHNPLPDWLTGGSFTNEQLRALLRKHVMDGEHTQDTARILAFTALSMLPALGFFVLAERRIAGGLSGAVKG